MARKTASKTESFAHPFRLCLSCSRIQTINTYLYSTRNFSRQIGGHGVFPRDFSLEYNAGEISDKSCLSILRISEQTSSRILTWRFTGSRSARVTSRPGVLHVETPIPATITLANARGCCFAGTCDENRNFIHSRCLKGEFKWYLTSYKLPVYLN